MNTSSAITQALIETRQHDRLARARRVSAGREAARYAAPARRTPAGTFAWPAHWLRLAVLRPIIREGV